jgi:hypothetical protein
VVVVVIVVVVVVVIMPVMINARSREYVVKQRVPSRIASSHGCGGRGGSSVRLVHHIGALSLALGPQRAAISTINEALHKCGMPPTMVVTGDGKTS